MRGGGAWAPLIVTEEDVLGIPRLVNAGSPAGRRFAHSCRNISMIGEGRGSPSRSQPRRTRTRRVAPSSMSGRLARLAPRGIPSTSTEEMPRVTPLGFSTVIS
jgi:hypothetical protein